MGIITSWFESYSHHQPIAQKSANSIKHTYPSKVASWSRQFWMSLTKWLVSSTEPQVSQRRDRYGMLIWRIYDPATNQSATFSSEYEVRVWLEQRYYH